MKLWRKLAKKQYNEQTGQVERNGRSIKQTMIMQELMTKNMARTTPLIDALFKRAGIQYSLSKKQQAVLKKMVEESKDQETANEAV